MLVSTYHKSPRTGLSLCAPFLTLSDVTVQLLHIRYKSISTMIKHGKMAPFGVKGNAISVVVVVVQNNVTLIIFL